MLRRRQHSHFRVFSLFCRYFRRKKIHVWATSLRAQKRKIVLQKATGCNALSERNLQFFTMMGLFLIHSEVQNIHVIAEGKKKPNGYPSFVQLWPIFFCSDFISFFGYPAFTTMFMRLALLDACALSISAAGNGRGTVIFLAWSKQPLVFHRFAGPRFHDGSRDNTKVQYAVWLYCMYILIFHYSFLSFICSSDFTEIL